MKILFFAMLLTCFTSKADVQLISTKERLRLHMWVYGLNDSSEKKVVVPSKVLPEELSKALQKI